MIETMKSVTIVAQASRRQEMLLSLRHAGLLHIRHLTRTCPASEEIAAKMHSLLGVMNAVVDEAGKSAKGIRQEKLDGDALDSMVCDLERTISQRKAAKDEHLRLSSEITRIEPWGDFDPDALKALAEEGYAFFFYTLDDNVLDAVRQDEDVVFVPLRDVNRMKAIAVLGARLPSRYSAREFTLPQASLTDLRERLAQLEKTIAQAHGTIADAAKYMDAFKLEVKRLEEASMFERVKATSQEEQNRIVFISGYLPEDRCDDFRSLAGENGWAYLIDDVADDEDPPTQLKYKGLIRIIQPIYDILGTVPGYREYDISSWFLLFFSVFFAMIIGDAGYGLIFLLIAVVMNVRAKKCSDANILLYVLSATTIIYGAVTGTWFGSLAVLEKLPFLQLFIIPSICNYSMELYGIESVYAQNAVMQLCFMLGAAQLGLACVLNVISKIRVRDLSLLGDIGWLIALHDGAVSGHRSQCRLHRRHRRCRGRLLPGCRVWQPGAGQELRCRSEVRTGWFLHELPGYGQLLQQHHELHQTVRSRYGFPCDSAVLQQHGRHGRSRIRCRHSRPGNCAEHSHGPAQRHRAWRQAQSTGVLRSARYGVDRIQIRSVQGNGRQN